MKIKVTLFFTLYLSAALGLAVEKPAADSTTCLFVKGYINSENEKVTHATIKLYRGNRVIDSVSSGKKHYFSFLLEKNESYTIEICRNGYFTKRISIPTTIPPGISIDPLFEFIFDVELIPEQEGINDDYLDFPAAIICYNSKTDAFEVNRNYTLHIREKIILALDPQMTANKSDSD